MKRSLIILIYLISLSGCSNRENQSKTIKDLVDKCNSPISVTLTVGDFGLGNSVSVTCVDTKKEFIR